MPRNGTGTYVLPAGQPVVPGTTISSSVFNTFTNDVATALTNSISTDGQTPMAANLPMGNNKLTGMAAGVSSGDAVNVGQLASSGSTLVTFDGGTLADFFKTKNNRVVDTIAALRALDKTVYTHAAVIGYYAHGDGGGGLYWYDSTDTTSTDNGGTIIVAADGGRWKISYTTELSLRQFGAKGDGSTDDTTACQAFLDACAGKRGFVNAGTYIVTTLNVSSNTWLEGEGSNVSILKRKGSAAGNAAVLNGSSVTGVTLRGIGFDGNKAAQSNAANTVTFSTADDIDIQGCSFINAKAVSGGYGSGLSLTDGSGQTNKRKSLVSRNRFSNNDAADCFISRTWYIEVSSNYMKGSSGGISVINFVFPPVAEVQNFITISNNIIRDQAGSGISFTGYVESGSSASNAKLGPGVPPQRYCTIQGNDIASCTAYGIAFQGSDSIIADNNVYLCGSVAQGGGFLMNAQACIFEGNTTRDCYHYGADCGGSYSCTIDGNNFYGNCATYAGSGTDLNVGGAFNMLIANNTFEQIGSQQMVAINALGVEGDGTAPFPLPAGLGKAVGLQIIGNKILLNSVATSIGVWVYGSQERVTVQNNHVRNAVGPNQAFILEAVELIANGNVDESTYSNGSPVQTVTSAATLVLPDVGNVFMVSGSTGITSIQSYSGNQNSGKVRVCQASSHGTGYSRSTPPTVTFAGGGGSGLAATAMVSYDGELVSWNVTNKGSGYTSAPTPTITHNGGSGGNCVPLVGCNNFEGREITLNFTGTLTVTSSTTLLLNGNYNVVPGKILRLMGLFGNWYEISRS